VFGNNFFSSIIYLDLKDKIDDACKGAKKTLDVLKRSWIAAGGYTLLRFYSTFCPHAFMDHIYSNSGAKFTLFLSNVPGFLKPVYYAGKPATRFFSLVTGSGNIATGINIVSMTETCQICITSDDS
jgi:hypothetical protein